jgi:elongation factor 2
MGPNYKPGSK